jgi:hypothetical protein
VKPDHPHLGCGDNVYIQGVGVRKVTDHGGGLATTQLDHFSGQGACGSVTDIGTRKVIKLY